MDALVDSQIIRSLTQIHISYHNRQGLKLLLIMRGQEM